MPVSRYSACEIAWHRWEQVSAIMGSSAGCLYSAGNCGKAGANPFTRVVFTGDSSSQWSLYSAGRVVPVSRYSACEIA